MEYKIYTLTCPIEGTVKYVGVSSSKDLNTRLQSHISGSEGTYKKLIWIERCRAKKLKPKIEVVETIITEDRYYVLETERYWIQQFKAWGFDLVNGMFCSVNKRKYISPQDYLQLKKNMEMDFNKEINKITKHAERK
jgi:hypothetical protein